MWRSLELSNDNARALSYRGVAASNSIPRGHTASRLVGTYPAGLAVTLFSEVYMRLQPPIRLVTTAEVRQALGPSLRDAAYLAYREIALAAKGLEIACLQFAFDDVTLAVCSRVRRDGTVEIEIGLGDARLRTRCFTQAELRAAEHTALRSRAVRRR
jgi:hypothetical protein